MTKLYVYAQVWMANLARKLHREEGAEAIEYLGMAVVIAVLVVGVIAVMNAQREDIGTLITDLIKKAINLVTGKF